MIHIRPATEADFAAILHVQQAAFGEYTNVYTVSGWTTETLESLREDAKEKHIFVAEAEGVVMGSVRFWTVAGGGYYPPVICGSRPSRPWRGESTDTRNRTGRDRCP